MNRRTTSRARRDLCRAALAACVALLAASVALLAFAVAPGGASGPASVRIGSAPALPAASEIGLVSPRQKLRLTVVLAPRDAAALSEFAAAVSKPGSPAYRHYLDVHQFAERFGADSRSIAAVRATLRADGLTLGATAPDNLSISVSGDAAHVSRAFAVTLHRFRERGGREVFANNFAPRLPAALSGIVSDVLGLDDLPAAAPEGLINFKSHRALAHAASGPFPGGLGPTPCADVSAYAASTGEYTINQIAQAYGMTGLYAQGDFGQGITVAMYELEAYPTQTIDLNTYQSCYGTATSVTTAPLVDGGSTSGVYSAETSVDLENMIGLAPQANIVIYEGPNTSTGDYDTLNAIVSDPIRAQVINDSWGICEPDQFSGLATSESFLLEQAATQGQSFISSTGDRGSEGCVCHTDPSCSSWVPANGGHALEVDDPASQPYTTGVGGSDLSSIGPPNIETAWNELYWGGSGGGISSTWAMPSYQTNSGVPGIGNSYSSGTPCSNPGGYCREVPDVSADAAPHQGYSIFWSGASHSGWSAAGGTSTAAPVWAALIALADAAGPLGVDGCNNSRLDTSRLGFLNPLLYEVAAGDGHATAFHDLTVGDNNPTFTGPYPATPGYDMASGLGTPIATAGSSPGLVAQMCAASQIPSVSPPTITALSTHESAVGTTVTITGTHFTPFAAVWFGNNYATNVSDPNNSTTQLIATVPPGNGSVNVQVLELAGATTNGPADAFTYAPTESISSPADGGAYTQGQALFASYSCASSTSGNPSCIGSQPNGAAIDTSTPGKHSFAVTATDANSYSTTTTVSYTVVPPPVIAISGPVPGATYAQGQVLAAQFSCSTSPPVAIASCAAPVADGAAVDTQTIGSHSFTVYATDSNGISTSRTVTYNVASPPRALISMPVDGAAYVRGASVVASFLCSATSPATIVSCSANTAADGHVDTATTGTHQFTATASDSDGVSSSSSVSYSVVAVRPQISGLREAASRLSAHGVKRTRLPVGTTFSFSLDQTAKVTLRFTRKGSGRRKSGRCVALSAAPARAPACALSLGAGNLSVDAQSGYNAVSFKGQTSTGNLGAGSYTVTLTAVGLSGKPSPPGSLHFTVTASG